ncbi:MAG: Aminomethyltransferase [uncultured bacterium]|nr:MAG: Aminomethyltransferase [uncultured bacterium]OGT25250.1 MAG: hypothetical protein A3B71_01945 [Gammaproteobacteria bacterium RIFCSPHIGHO2_02_FULL_42_43]OGT28368.1 MAG: hypothetical protein A2624_02855 [Gammaproteobacteria bacterium RIFCSPHIGHO2_01_FULL_42_8]OGT51204.1 MAG: hypothetical protein A3E54_03135 [Gammaproteobacteria bacterium RIFCSPHIGHO2_12_FULL_41_25]OGT62966.1 MAG: hypothetical protein A3I77_05380 [Gammaproteobacteria bacterium RIFCSPLOWO2_02_FULL_42_14]OGT86098.1 MAG: hyp
MHTGLSAISLIGEKSQEFLQGQLTCDMRRLNAPGAHSLMGCCDPKGRVLANGWVINWHYQFFLIVPQSMVAILIHHLNKFALFSKVRLQEKKDYFLIAEAQVTEKQSDNIYISLLGVNRFLHIALKNNHDSAVISTDETMWRKNNILNLFAVITPATSVLFTPQMIALDQQGGVSFDKGCYVGQEIVARTHYLGKVKRKLCLMSLPHAYSAGDVIEGTSNIVVDAVKIDDACYQALVVA